MWISQKTSASSQRVGAAAPGGLGFAASRCSFGPSGRLERCRESISDWHPGKRI